MEKDTSPLRSSLKNLDTSVQIAMGLDNNSFDLKNMSLVKSKNVDET